MPGVMVAGIIEDEGSRNGEELERKREELLGYVDHDVGKSNKLDVRPVNGLDSGKLETSPVFNGGMEGAFPEDEGSHNIDVALAVEEDVVADCENLVP